jgi:hypothetical protein
MIVNRPSQAPIPSPRSVIFFVAKVARVREFRVKHSMAQGDSGRLPLPRPRFTISLKRSTQNYSPIDKLAGRLPPSVH